MLLSDFSCTTPTPNPRGAFELRESWTEIQQMIDALGEANLKAESTNWVIEA